MSTTHLRDRIIETHTTQDGRAVAETVHARRPAETGRLRSLARTLDPQRPFGVVRNIITSSAKAERKGPRTFEEITLLVLAPDAATAGRLADAHKFEVERQLGHHNGEVAR